MPDKLILNIEGNQGHVFVEIDGTRHKLRRCKSITIRADAEGKNEADLTLYAFDFTSEVEITRNNADAILRFDARRSLAFLDDKDAKALRDWRESTRKLEIPSGYLLSDALPAIDKIIAELARREEITF